jgi:phosphopentomutase
MTISRAVFIVFDSLGVGALPDAADYGDSGANTLVNTARAAGGLNLPNLAALGLGHIVPVSGVPPVPAPRAAFGKMGERSAGKDTTTGHWELMGLWTMRPFPVFPQGFPAVVTTEFEQRAGVRIIGNKAASGTEIISELGEEHQRTGRPIVYTSADSVWQIAAHLDVFPLDRLYELCRIARDLLKGDYGVARVIARPFVGGPGAYIRTAGRRDFSVEPHGPTLLTCAADQGVPVLAAGKVGEIFAGSGISESRHTGGNDETFDMIVEYMRRPGRGMIVANLGDFDTLWGHRNDPLGYAAALERADARLAELLALTRPDDALLIVGDHGCDPTTPSTDHSREYVPLLLVGDSVNSGVDLGVRPTFADAAQTVAEAMGLKVDLQGHSLWPLVRS